MLEGERVCRRAGGGFMLFPPESESPLQNLSRTGKGKLNCGGVLLFSIVSPRSIRACPGEGAWGQKDCTRLVFCKASQNQRTVHAEPGPTNGGTSVWKIGIHDGAPGQEIGFIN